jgi:hypothetical protein
MSAKAVGITQLTVPENEGQPYCRDRTGPSDRRIYADKSSFATAKTSHDCQIDKTENETVGEPDLKPLKMRDLISADEVLPPGPWGRGIEVSSSSRSQELHKILMASL